MPRNPGTGVYTQPAPDVVAGTTIESKVYNDFVNDVELDLNTARPIVAGGTGADDAKEARDNLDAEVAMAQVTDYGTQVWESGSFYSLTSATAPPVAGHAFFGTAQVQDANNIVLEARDESDTLFPGQVYVREKKAGTWVNGGAWTVDQSGAFVLKAGDTMTGALILKPTDASSPSLILDRDVVGKASSILGRLNGVTRWRMVLGDSNAAADFYLTRYNDAGTQVDNPIQVARSDGSVYFAKTVNFGTASTNSFFATSDGTANTLNLSVTGGGTYVSAGVSTGNFTLAQAGNFAMQISASACNINRQTTVAANLICTAAAPVVSSFCNTLGNGVGVYQGSDNLMYFVNTNATTGATAGGYRMYLHPTAGMYLSGATGAKAGGGVWADSSDARIKTVNGNYDNGLDAILTLQPVRYTFKGNDTPANVHPSKEGSMEPGGAPSKDAVPLPYPNSGHYQAAVSGREFIGLIAQDCETAFPEMVAQIPGTIDGQPVTDLRHLDTGPLIFALVNAVKTLAARIEALEAAS